MIRVSDCRYLLALVFASSVVIMRPGTFLDPLFLSKDREVEFNLKEGKYIYLEWPVINDIYLERGPYFLTLDDLGKLRIHYIKEIKEEIIGEEDRYRSACFSVDGRHIYAINEKQEVCRIDLSDMKIISRRVIRELSDPENVKSTHLMQVTASIFAVGSTIKNGEGCSEPYIHLVQGDISDPECQLKIKEFHIPSTNNSITNIPVRFRFLYVKERYLKIRE